MAKEDKQNAQPEIPEQKTQAAAAAGEKAKNRGMKRDMILSSCFSGKGRQVLLAAGNSPSARRIKRRARNTPRGKKLLQSVR